MKMNFTLGDTVCFLFCQEEQGRSRVESEEGALGGDTACRVHQPSECVLLEPRPGSPD